MMFSIPSEQPMTDASRSVPVGWGEDVLSEFQAIAMNNELASFVHDPGWHALLSDIATVLNECAKAILSVLKIEDSPAPSRFIRLLKKTMASYEKAQEDFFLGFFPCHARVRATSSTGL